MLGVVLGASIGHDAVALGARSARTAGRGTIRGADAADRPRVLLIGDSILDQQGSAAAFLLRQAGVDARAIGRWGSGLLTRDQYDRGVTKRSGSWLRDAAREIATFDPAVVGVYMNHNYWPPYPRDARGRTITDLWSPAGQRMIGQQARALITILRRRGATVFFIAPVPAGAIPDPDPAAWSPIWHGYLPVLRAMHVRVADTADPLETPAGLRSETKPSCTGAPERVRARGDLHLTRFGAGRAGTALAEFVAGLVHADLRGNAAPGDAAAALVPAADRRGYWIVGCDGSVYDFGDAARLAGVRRALAGHGPAVAAVATPSGGGLWIVAADGTVAGTGDARPLTLPRPASGPIVAAAAGPRGNGLWVTTVSGEVLRTGGRPEATARPVPLTAKIVGIAATRDGRGYWLVAADGAVFAFGDARAHGSVGRGARGAIVGLAPTADDGGYWLLRRDGAVFAFGDARPEGDAEWRALRYPYDLLTATPGPAAGIVANGAAGYWIFGTTGRVVSRGALPAYGGDNNLALLTQ